MIALRKREISGPENDGTDDSDSRYDRERDFWRMLRCVLARYEKEWISETGRR